MTNAMMTASNTEQTMSSREIAEATGKLHKNVKRDILTMFEELEVDALNFERTYLDGQNRPQMEYLLNRYYTELLITGYDVRRRAAVLTRWMELEEKDTQPQVPQTLPEALRLAADTHEKYEQAKLEKQEAEDKADRYETVIGANRHSLNQFARTLPGLNSNKLKADLLFFGYLYNRGGGYRRYAHFSHLFEEQLHETYGSREIYPTEKGKQLILDLFERGALTMKKAFQK